MPVRLHCRDAQELKAWEDHAQPVGKPNDSSHMLERDQLVVIVIVNGLAGQQAIEKTHDRNASRAKVWEGHAQPVGKPNESSRVPEQDQVVVNGPAGQRAVKKTGGYGHRMLENLEKQGKPVDARMRQMADWMDSMDTGDDGQVRLSIEDRIQCRQRYCDHDWQRF